MKATTGNCAGSPPGPGAGEWQVLRLQCVGITHQVFTKCPQHMQPRLGGKPQNTVEVGRTFPAIQTWPIPCRQFKSEPVDIIRPQLSVSGPWSLLSRGTLCLKLSFIARTPSVAHSTFGNSSFFEGRGPVLCSRWWSEASQPLGRVY